jgi:hypothetical protein
MASDFEHAEEQAASLPVEPSTAARNAEVLAGEACNDAIHRSAPCASVEGEDVRPDRSRIQAAFLYARRQDCGGVCFPLDVADGASLDAQMSEPGSQSFSKHSHAGAEFEGT